MENVALVKLSSLLRKVAENENKTYGDLYDAMLKMTREEFLEMCRAGDAAQPAATAARRAPAKKTNLVISPDAQYEIGGTIEVAQPPARRPGTKRPPSVTTTAPPTSVKNPVVSGLDGDDEWGAPAVKPPVNVAANTSRQPIVAAGAEW